MKKLLTAIISFFLLSAFYFLQPTLTHAADNFTTSYDVTYAVSETGLTHVTMKVNLTNESSQYFASSYKLNVGFDELENITAEDPAGKLNPTVTKTDEGHAISLKFGSKVVGKDKTLPFTVAFDTKDVAKVRGTILSVTVPGIAKQQEFSDFVVHVVVPESFGKPVYLKPKTTDETLTFTKDRLGTGGISLAFGEKQAYDFFLTYHLQNKNILPIRTEIALPPSTNYQDVYYTSLEPRPSDVSIDPDGNWLAVYDLEPSQSVDVVARGKATLSLTPRKQAETEERLKAYLRPDTYWEVDNPQMQKLARELKTPEAIYTYVMEQLTYDFTRVTDSKARLGALKALTTPDSAVCLEFTDLFITLARAAGIPAREVNGYAYTENDKQRPLSLVKDILHAWPEYYDREQQTWIMIDPTWGKTTGGIDYFHVLDFDHFTFVRKGIDSEYPVPAGGYKARDTDGSKDVHVEFSTIHANTKPRLDVESIFNDQALSWLPIQGKLRVKNNGTQVSGQTTMTITSDTLTPATQTVQLPQIPPYGVEEIPLAFQSSGVLTNTTHAFTIQVAGLKSTYRIHVVPFIFPELPYLIGGIIGISIVIVLIITLKSRRLPFPRR